MTASAAPPQVRAMEALESATPLDRVVSLARPLGDALIGSPVRRRLLQGHWLGHAVHPMLTDLPLGMWMSAALLDLVGGRRSRSAATLLVGAGIATAVPTALTGLAEWAPIGQPEKRVGTVHALSNSVGLMCYVGSLTSRLRGRHSAGVALGLAGGVSGVVGGYLGGHLTTVRKISSFDPAFGRSPADVHSPDE